MGYLVTKPFEIFLDTDGTPLENGYLYFGAVSQNPETNPISIYWDADLTIPAANPVRTVNGYAARNGTPANLYTASNYSITVKDKNGRLVYNSPLQQVLDSAVTQQVDDIATLRTINPSSTRVVYVKYHTTAFDGGHGTFEAITGAAPGTYIDDGWKTIVPTGGDGSSAWIRNEYYAEGVSDLRNKIPYPERIVELLYHTTSGDGGHGTFEALTGAAPGTYTDDNGITIVPTGGDGSSCWRRVLDGGKINVLWYNADRTGMTDSYSAIAAAVAFANTSTDYKTVYFPIGEYESSQAIVCYPNVSLIGEDSRVHHLNYDANTPRMPTLRFTTNSDGIVFNAQFFKNQIKNLGIWSGVALGASTGIGLRISTNDATLAASTVYEGLSNIYENVEVYGWMTGVKISGAYSWYQYFESFTAHNCKTAVDIECQSSQHIRFNNYYFNCDSGVAWAHADRTGLIIRAGGRITLDNGIVENMGSCFKYAATTYSDLVAKARDRQLYIRNLYTEAMLLNVFKWEVPGYLEIDNLLCSYGFYSAFTNVFLLAFTSLPTEKTYINANEIQVIGNASPDNRRIRKLFSSTANGPASVYQVSLENVEIYYNDFEVLWEVNYPPNYISFKERDNAGNAVEVFQRSTETNRAYASIENDAGNVPTNSLVWTNAHGNTLNLGTLTNHLTTIDPIRRKQNRNRLPVFYDNIAAINGTTKNANDYSGVRYGNFTGAPAAITLTIDTTNMNYGDEIFVSDHPTSTGTTTCTITIGSETITNNTGEFVVIRRCRLTGSSTATIHLVVARGTV